MKQVSIESVERDWYVAHPQLARSDWPYRAQFRPAQLARADEIAPPQFDADKCGECGGSGMAWSPKNQHTGSLTLAPCERCR